MKKNENNIKALEIVMQKVNKKDSLINFLYFNRFFEISIFVTVFFL